MSASILSQADLKALIAQRRLDLAIKLRFFRHLHQGGDPDSERLYRWHILTRTGGRERRSWKASLDDYVEASGALVANMGRSGFDINQPVTICRMGRLKDGAHRIAAALLFSAPIYWMQDNVIGRARAWDEIYLKQKGIDPCDLSRIVSDYARLENEISNSCDARSDDASDELGRGNGHRSKASRMAG